MAQFEVIRFAIELEIRRINDPCAGSPRDSFLSLFFADLEIVIEKSPLIVRQRFSSFANVFNREIRQFDFFASPVFQPDPGRRLLFRRRISATNWTGKSQQAAEQKDESRIIFHVPEVFGVFWNIGSDSSSLTHGNLSSSQMFFS